MADDIDVSAEEDIERMLDGLKDDPMLADVLDRAENPTKGNKSGPKVKTPKAAPAAPVVRDPVPEEPVEETESKEETDKDLEVDEDIVSRNLPVPAPQAGAVVGGDDRPLITSDEVSV